MKTTPKGNPIVEPNPQRGPACLAPPLTPELLDTYESLIDSAAPPVADAMRGLITMVRTFLQTPASTLPGVRLETEYTRNPFKGPDGKPKPPPEIVPLEPEEIDRIWDLVPWPHEVEAMRILFRQLPRGPLQDAARHLEWYAKELTLDREPMTKDRL